MARLLLHQSKTNPMQKSLLLIIVLSILIACGSAKTTEQALNTGNYNKAIAISLQKLKSNKTKKGNQQYVLMLQDAFAKAVERDEDRIEFLRKDGNPENAEEIFNLFNNLKNRQQRVKPILPLPIHSSGTNAQFVFKNYSDALIESKNDLSEHLYKKSLSFVNSENKQTLRSVYKDLEYINEINPNYKDVQSLMNNVHAFGTDHILVSMKNKSETLVPEKLQEYLLNFDTFGLNNFWTVYHNTKLDSFNYDFGMELNLTNILVSPERISEKEIVEEKLIKDGYKYAVDSEGVQLKDSLGKSIKVDNFVKIRCHLYQISQSKSSKVDGQVKYINLKSNQVFQVFPISSEFLFQHVYATHSGDKRALKSTYIDMLGLRAIPFPSNEQMVYDTGSDLKNKLKGIIQKNNFR